MISRYLSATWPALAPAIANHLWQSTLFAIIAGALTLTLRKTHARVRYWLWLAASVKFLIPFSLLVVLGSQLARPRATAAVQPVLHSAAQEVATVSDFLTVGLSPIQKPTVSPEAADRGYSLLRLLPAGIGTVWFGGFAAVLCVWCIRWRRMSAALREATPFRGGREVEALRRLERRAGTRTRIKLVMSRGSLEPGIFGIVRPILVWPEGISKRLSDAHLESIIAHEVWHVRRRDNLAAMLHMVVEAIFWFHPLVWWLGARLVEERERACDEEVLTLGSQPQVYAESILKACEFCVASPLACVSGVTGANLKARMVRIMTHRALRQLDGRKKLLLAATGFLAVAVPVGFGLAHGQQGQAGQASAPESAAAASAETPLAKTAKFEVASIKPFKPSGPKMMFRIMNNRGRLYATGPNVRMLIGLAYGVQESRIVGGPSWINSDRFDIQAKADSATAGAMKKLTEEQAKLVQQHMLQNLLADRFGLKLHHETRELPLYALVVAKNGPKLEVAKEDASAPADQGPTGDGPVTKARRADPSAQYPDSGAPAGDGSATATPATGRGPAIARLRGAGVMMRSGGGEQQINFRNSSLGLFVTLLAQMTGRNVVDKTGLTGNYNFDLHFVPDMAMRPMGGPGPGVGGPGPGGAPGEVAIGGGAGPGGGVPSGVGAPAAPDVSGPSIFTALQEQLGLKLQSEKGPVDVLVIDHVEQPSEN